MPLGMHGNGAENDDEQAPAAAEAAENDDEENVGVGVEASSLVASATATAMVLVAEEEEAFDGHVDRNSIGADRGGGDSEDKFMSFYDNHCVYLPAMLGWFLFSALLSSYNKLVFGEGHMAFPCPLLLTSIHFSVQWMFSEALCGVWPKYFGGDRIRRMSWWEYLSVGVPCGLVTSGDIGLSNLSLVTISITFYTMVKSSTPVFVLGWAYLFGIEKITWSLIMVVVIIAAGEFLTVVGEVDFDVKGFALCISGSMLSGARWTLVQLKIQSLDPPLKTTIATMKVLAPSMFASMLVLSLAIEHPWNRFGDWTASEFFHIVGLGLVGAFLAIAMVLCEFHLIMYSSAIVLMIGGVIKEIITIFVGVLYFRDELNRINLAGCFVVFLGVVLYKVSYHLTKNREEKRTVVVSAAEDAGGSSRRSNSYRTLSVTDSGDDPIDMLADEESTKGLQLAEGVEQRRPLSASSASSSISEHQQHSGTLT